MRKLSWCLVPLPPEYSAAAPSRVLIRKLKGVRGVGLWRDAALARTLAEPQLTYVPLLLVARARVIF